MFNACDDHLHCTSNLTQFVPVSSDFLDNLKNLEFVGTIYFNIKRP